MRTEPPPSRWQIPTPKEGLRDLVGIGGDLEPGTLLAAYRSGLFPMPHDGGRIAWFSPDPRAIIEVERFAASRSLRRSTRRFTVTHDTCFDDVVEACASPERPNAWITREFRRGVRAAAQHGLGSQHRGLGRLRGHGRRTLWSIDRRSVRRGVHVPSGDRRIQGGSGAPHRPAPHGANMPSWMFSGSPGTWLRSAQSRSRGAAYLQRLVIALSDPTDPFAFGTCDSGNRP